MIQFPRRKNNRLTGVSLSENENSFCQMQITAVREHQQGKYLRKHRSQRIRQR